MKRILGLLGLLIAGNLFAQTDPVSWNNTVKKLDANTYEIHLAATVKSPWHLYSQSTPEDGPIPTSISFSKNPLITLTGKVQEKGELIKKHEEVFGVDVMYFNRSVDFVQIVKVRAKVKTSINGTVNYMVCNDKECLAPKTIKFSLALE